MYTFMTDHLPKADINLCHPYQETVLSQMSDPYFVAEWKRYEAANRMANRAHLERGWDLNSLERRKKEAA